MWQSQFSLVMNAVVRHITTEQLPPVFDEAVRPKDEGYALFILIPRLAVSRPHLEKLMFTSYVNSLLNVRALPSCPARRKRSLANAA